MIEQQVRKLTAERLALVEKIQSRMREVAEDLGSLISEEENGWVPGSPRPSSLARVEPLEKMLAEVESAVAGLEVLYS